MSISSAGFAIEYARLRGRTMLWKTAYVAALNANGGIRPDALVVDCGCCVTHG
jgi:hypothetical protein